MTKRHNDEVFDSLIKHVGFEILSGMADEIPDRQTILARIGNTDAMDNVIKKTIKKDLNKRHIRKAGRIMLRVAAVLLIFLVVSAVAIVSSKALRTSIMNLFYLVDDDTAKISIIEENDDERFDQILKPSYLPEGFYLVEQTPVNELMISIYENANGDTITIEQIQGGLQMIGGEEKANSQELEINDRPAFLMENEEFNVLIACSNEASVTVTADVEISIEELIKITKSLFNK